MISNLALIITKKCNLECPFCLADAKPSSIEEELTQAQFLEALNRFPQLSFIKITGGEPLMPGIVEKTYAVTEWALSKEIVVQINTNGTHSWPYDFGKKNSLIRFQVSIDGPEPIHDALRGVGVYKLATSFIEDLVTRHYSVSVMSVITETDSNNFLQIMADMAKLNVGVNFQFVNNSGRGGSKFKRNFQKISKVVENTQKDIENLGANCRSIVTKCNMHLGACGHYAALDPQGYIVPCPSLDTHRICHYMEYNDIGTAVKMKRLITDKNITCFSQERPQ